MKLLKKLTKRKSKKNKYSLYISQKNGQMFVRGQTNKENYFIKELWLFCRESNEGFKISKQTPMNQFDFKVSLEGLFDILSYNEEERTFDWYLKVKRPFSEIKDNKKNNDKIEVIETKDDIFVEYFIRCGKFQYTHLENLSFFYRDNVFLIPYVTTHGNLSVAFNHEPDSPTRLQIDKIKNKSGQLKIKGKIFSRNSIIKNGSMVLKGRETGLELSSNRIRFNYLGQQTTIKYGLNRYTYEAVIDLVEANQGKQVLEDIYDLFFNLNLHDSHQYKQVRIGRPTFRAKLFLSELYAKTASDAIIINPYFTFKKENLSFEVYNYPIDSYNYLRKLLRFSWIIRLFNKRKDVWLVGERTYKAQDTGYAFFKYMRTRRPEKNVYYVIDKDSPERVNVEKYGNVLEFKSKEHIWYTIIASKVISSHHPDYLYPIRTPKFKKKIKADKVFLQHGVMGTKNMVANYGKRAQSFETDLFMVSSDFEKEMIVNDFGYDSNEVFVTGLSRFDSLFAKDVEQKRQILIIPTWRDWILTDELFFESEYYKKYSELINSRKLREFAVEYEFEVLFCLHPNMQRFSASFENNVVKVINQGEIDVQHLIKESAMMITDYSSVGFDFSFLHKPIVYYQFDRSRFIGARPSHLDLDNDLPGEIAFKQDEVLDLILEYSKNNFIMKDKYKSRADKFIKYRDQNSSERIFNVIKSNTVRKSFLDNPHVKLLNEALYAKFRKSKKYFPIMKMFYNLGRKVIPVNRNLILFESGIGKQLGDSPKNIYDEILNQDLNYKKVWVYNKPHRFIDLNTKKIKRLSPQYYFYLLRAGYWVNNQNFPTYIKKRPETTYLQTWHGTPLKKMLYDIEEVHGRSDDYVERVGTAVSNWDYLISPSPYASNAFRSAFRYEGEILETGYPRNDILYSDNKDKIRNRVINRLHIPKNKKVILYAPTFRDNQTSKKNKFLFDIELDLHKMREHLGNEYIILLRMHVVIQNKLNIEEELTDFVYNVSSYPDIQELLLISDILITDYSSVMFDFANTKKPMLFYTYDLEEYRDSIRGFYMDFEKEAPGPLLYTTDEIVENILNIEKVIGQFSDKYQLFNKKYCLLEDGNASNRVVNKVFK